MTAGHASAQPVDQRLARAQALASEQLRNTADFVCTQLVDRSRWRSGENEPSYQDALRLEVGFVGGEEVFGWPGASSFESDAAAILGDGAFSTGDFLSHARALFLSRKGAVSFAAETAEGLRYDYVVAELPTGYRVATASGSAEVLYHGAFWVDPRSLELRRLTVVTDHVPAQVGIKLVQTDIRYRTVQLRSGAALLPTEAEIRTDYTTGAALRNAARFEDCRAFETFSSITFGDEESSAARQHAGEAALPAPGAHLFVRLHTPIEWGASRVGDPLEVELLRPVRTAAGKTLPKGTTLTLRLRRLQRRTEPQRFFVVGLSFDGVDAMLESFSASGADIQLLETIRLRDQVDTHRAMIAEAEGRPALEGVRSFYVFGAGLELRDARMRWRIAE